jgi:hypothetical protein
MTKESITINGIEFTFTSDPEKLKNISPMPRVELRRGEDGTCYHHNLDTEEAIIKMINGSQNI